MANWRTLNISGHIEMEDIHTIYEFLFFNWREVDKLIDCEHPNWDKFEALTSKKNCLSIPGERTLGGLNNWLSTQIHTIGSVEAEGGVDEIKQVLEEINELSSHSPYIKIHCGDDYERDECIATVILKNDRVIVYKPEIENIIQKRGFELMEDLEDIVYN